MTLRGLLPISFSGTLAPRALPLVNYVDLRRESSVHAVNTERVVRGLPIVVRGLPIIETLIESWVLAHSLKTVQRLITVEGQR